MSADSENPNKQTPANPFDKEETRRFANTQDWLNELIWMYGQPSNSKPKMPNQPGIYYTDQFAKPTDITKTAPWLLGILGGPAGMAGGKYFDKRYDLPVYLQGGEFNRADLINFFNNPGGGNLNTPGGGSGGMGDVIDTRPPVGTGAGLDVFRANAAGSVPYDRKNFPGWAPLDPTKLPGWTDIPAYDFNSLMQQYMSLGAGGQGGGGGGGGGGIANSSANQFLNQLFQGGGQNFGNLDPNLLGMVTSLQDQNTGEYADLTNFIKSQGNGLLASLMNDPSMGGGGGGFNMGGGGGNAGGYSIPDFGSLFSQIPGFDPGKIDPSLHSLSPEVLAELQTMQDAELGGVEQMRKQVTDQLATQLFGQGIQRSTVAGEAIGRASTGLEQNLLQARAQGSQRKLGLMTDEANRSLQGQLATQATRLGAYQTQVGSATDLEKAHIGANAQIQSAAIGANAAAASAYSSQQSALQAARMNTLASIFDTQVKGLASGFGDRSSVANNFGNIFGTLAGSDQKSQIEKMLGIGGIAQDNVASQRQAQVAMAGQRSANAARQQGAMLDFLKFQEGVADRLQGGLMGISGQDLQRYLGNVNAWASVESAKSGKKSQTADWAQIAGALASMYGAYASSDERLKTNIMPISGAPGITEDEVLKLVPFTYVYKHDQTGQVHSGVMAQHLADICPDAIIEDPGTKFLFVDYRKLAVELLIGYRQLVKSIRDSKEEN